MQRKSRTIRRRLLWRDIREISLGLLAGIAFFVFAGMLAVGHEDGSWLPFGVDVEVARWDAAALVVISGLWLFFAGYQLVSRRRQEQRERRFHPSLRGDLDRMISQTDYRIRMATSVVWWGLLPVWLATVLLVQVLFRLVSTPPAVWILVAIVVPVGFALDVLFKRRLMRAEFLRLKQEFVSLHRKLTDSEQPA